MREEKKDSEQVQQKNVEKVDDPICSTCQQSITGQGLQALGKKWHPECFVCSSCKNQLTGSFMHHDGKPYCIEDFQKNFSKVCGGCGKMIEGQFIKAMDKEWHPTGCFVCCNCKGTLSSGFFNKGGKPYCQNCA